MHTFLREKAICRRSSKPTLQPCNKLCRWRNEQIHLLHLFIKICIIALVDHLCVLFCMFIQKWLINVTACSREQPPSATWQRLLEVSVLLSLCLFCLYCQPVQFGTTTSQKLFYVTVFSIIVLSAFCYKFYHSDFLLRHTTVRFRCFLVTRVVQRVWVLSQTPFLLQNKREFVSLAGIALAFVNHYTIKPPFYWDTQCIQKMDICFNISQ